MMFSPSIITFCIANAIYLVSCSNVFQAEVGTTSQPDFATPTLLCHYNINDSVSPVEEVNVNWWASNPPEPPTQIWTVNYALGEADNQLDVPSNGLVMFRSSGNLPDIISYHSITLKKPSKYAEYRCQVRARLLNGEDMTAISFPYQIKSIPGKLVRRKRAFFRSNPFQRRGCFKNPCRHKGVCISRGSTSFYCICRKGVRGQRCETQINLALHARKRTDGSPIQQYYWREYATDGNRDANMGPNDHFCYITQMVENPWFAVELDDYYEITLIKLYNRVDCCADRLRNLVFAVSNSSYLYEFCDYKSGPSSYSIVTSNCRRFFKTGKFVIARLNTVGILQICEFEVYGRGDFPDGRGSKLMHDKFADKDKNLEIEHDKTHPDSLTFAGASSPALLAAIVASGLVVLSVAIGYLLYHRRNRRRVGNGQKKEDKMEIVNGSI